MGGFNIPGGFGNLQNLMKQAQKMQQDMEKAKEDLANTDFVGSSGGGMVQITVSGDKKVKKVSIKPEVVDDSDVEMLEDLVMSAFNDAIDQVVSAEKEKMPNIPQGL